MVYALAQQLYSLYTNTKVGWFAPQIAGKLVVAGQEKYMNNTNYLIKTKTLNYKKALPIALKNELNIEVKSSN